MTQEVSRKATVLSDDLWYPFHNLYSIFEASNYSRRHEAQVI